MMHRESFLAICLALHCALTFAFAPSTPFFCRQNLDTPRPTALSMAKGLNKGKVTQADLARKMALAKQQRDGADISGPVSLAAEITISSAKLSPEEIKKRNDRLRFEELLNSGGAAKEFAGDNYLTKMQDEIEIDAKLAGIDRLFEGDPAPTQCFEELVSIKSEEPIGSGGASRLVPWLRKNEARRNDFLIIICDPRMKSVELRQSMKTILLEVNRDIISSLIVVNADTPAENRRWLKSAGEFDVYSDEKMEWMRAYTALGTIRWSMNIFVVANERVEKIARDVEAIHAAQTVTNMAKWYNV